MSIDLATSCAVAVRSALDACGHADVVIHVPESHPGCMWLGFREWIERARAWSERSGRSSRSKKDRILESVVRLDFADNAWKRDVLEPGISVVDTLGRKTFVVEAGRWAVLDYGCDTWTINRRLTVDVERREVGTVHGGYAARYVGRMASASPNMDAAVAIAMREVPRLSVALDAHLEGRVGWDVDLSTVESLLIQAIVLSTRFTGGALGGERGIGDTSEEERKTGGAWAACWTARHRALAEKKL